MLNLFDLVPGEARRVFDRVFQIRGRVAVGDDVKPVEVAPVFGDAFLVGRQENGAGRRPDAFDFNQPEFACDQMDAAEVKADVLILHVFNLAAARLLVGDDGGNRLALGFAVGFEVRMGGDVAFRVRQHERHANAFHSLQ